MMSQLPNPDTERPAFDFKDESSVQKLARKSKDSPLMLFGLTSCFIIAGAGLYGIKNRGKLSMSNYLMQLRVTAQGAVIGCLTLGVVKSLYDRYYAKKDDSE